MRVREREASFVEVLNHRIDAGTLIALQPPLASSSDRPQRPGQRRGPDTREERDGEDDKD